MKKADKSKKKRVSEFKKKLKRATRAKKVAAEKISRRKTFEKNVSLLRHKEEELINKILESRQVN